MPVTTTNTRTLPQPQLVAQFEELFEKKRIDGEVSGLVSQAYRRRRVMNDEMRPDGEQRSRLLRLRSIDAEFAHTVVQSGAVEAQARGCSVGTTNHPTRLTQDLHDVLAFDCLESY